MNGAITDGSISNENEALFPKYRIKNPIIEGRVLNIQDQILKVSQLNI